MNDFEWAEKTAQENITEIKTIMIHDEKEENENISNVLGRMKSEDTLTWLKEEGILN